LVAVTERYFPINYFNGGLIGVQADQMCLKDIIKLKLNDLDEQFRAMDIDLSAMALNWFMSIFYDAVPFEVINVQHLSDGKRIYKSGIFFARPC
jgi:hypothetical protein